MDAAQHATWRPASLAVEAHQPLKTSAKRSVETARTLASISATTQTQSLEMDAVPHAALKYTGSALAAHLLLLMSAQTSAEMDL